MSAVQGKFPNSAYWFNQMYYGTNSAFRRSRAGRGLAFPSNVLSVRGFMEGNTYHSILNISVTPTRYCQNSPSRGVSCFCGFLLLMYWSFQRFIFYIFLFSAFLFQFSGRKRAKSRQRWL